MTIQIGELVVKTQTLRVEGKRTNNIHNFEQL